MRAVIKSASFRLLLLLAFLLISAESGLATTVVLPPDDDLIIGARAIVRAKVTAVECGLDDRERIFTYITLRVQEVIKGQIADRYIIIKERGGQVGSQGSIFFGTPQFKPGERVLLYLDTWNDGSLRVHQMFLGKFSIIEDPSTGRSIVVRETPDAHTTVLDQAHSHEAQNEYILLTAITNRMELSDYVAMVRGRLAANRERCERFEDAYYRNVSVLSQPPEYNRAAGRGFQPQFTFLSNPPPRWFEPDSGQPVVFVVNTEGMPNPQIMDDITAAMNAWSTVPGCSLRVINGGTTSVCYEYDVNNLVFNNCDGQFAPSSGCAGILAFGGLSWDSRETKVINGRTFYRAHTGHISFNPYASCAYQDHCNVQEIVTHELGHALGLGHSWRSCLECPSPTPAQLDATMNGTAHFDGRCASIRQDDIDGIKFAYPASGEGSGPLAIVSASPLPTGVVGRSYSHLLLASGGTGAYSWSLVEGGGSLPPGLSLNSDGVISGTPSSAGTFNFTVQVRDAQSATAQKALSITVNAASSQYDAQLLSQTVPETLKPGETFSARIKWRNTGTEAWNGSSGFRLGSQNPANNQTWGGDRVPLYFFFVPAGEEMDLTFYAFAPITPGTYNFQWQPFQEGVGFFGQMSTNVSIKVSDGSSLSITSPSSVEATKGQSFTHQLTATGGTPPYTWQVQSGTLPAGLNLNATTGIISGTPTETSNSTVTIQVNDSESRTAQKAISITVLPPPVEIMTAGLPPVQRGAAYSHQIVAAGGKPPYMWMVVDGVLPVGVNLSPATGVIAGTPATAGIFGFTVEVKDSESRAARKTLSINVVPPPISIELATRVEAIKGSPFSYQPAAAGGTPPYTWSVQSGALPAGLTLNAATGLISGTPTESGLFAASVAVRDQATANASGAFEIRVIDPETIPAITKVKYKAGRKKLTVKGDRINPAAVLLIDGSQVAASPDEGQFLVKRLSLSSGQHEIKIMNPGNIFSQPHILIVD